MTLDTGAKVETSNSAQILFICFANSLTIFDLKWSSAPKAGLPIRKMFGAIWGPTKRRAPGQNGPTADKGGETANLDFWLYAEIIFGTA
jgi:hypothetical protein